MTITYVIGDATLPCRTPALIMHVCNDIGAWGSGFVVPLGKRYPAARAAYLDMSERPLGFVQFTPEVPKAETEIAVANMIAQHGIGRGSGGVPPIRYDALDEALDRVGFWLSFAKTVLDREWTVHAPRIGCGLAGGSWSRVEPLIARQLAAHQVFVYDLPG